MTLMIDDGKVSMAPQPEVAAKPVVPESNVAKAAVATKRIFPHEKFKESLAHVQKMPRTGHGLSDQEMQAVSLFCERHLEQAIEQGRTEFRAGERFTQGGAAYKLPRTIEIVTDSNGKKNCLFGVEQA